MVNLRSFRTIRNPRGRRGEDSLLISRKEVIRTESFARNLEQLFRHRDWFTARLDWEPGGGLDGTQNEATCPRCPNSRQNWASLKRERLRPKHDSCVAVMFP
jgi:hypothetical protein